MRTELTIRVAGEGGRALSEAYIATLYCSALDYEPFRNSILQLTVVDGQVRLTPPAEPFQASMVMPVEGFGSVYVYADNAGEGFNGEEREIDFTLEAARTRLARVQRWMTERASPGFTASSEAQDKLSHAQECLEAAQKAGARSERRCAAALESLRASLWAGEIVVLEKARQDIARRGCREGFLFGGANLLGRPSSRRKRELFLDLFNYATVVLHWRVFEPHRGEKAWERVDELVAWLEQNDITAKGHPLMWLNRVASPDWVLASDFRDYATHKQIVLDRAYDIVSHYRGTIDTYDVANEAHDWANVFDYSEEQLVELTGLTCDVARDANPEVIRVINTLWEWGQYVATGKYHSLEGLRESIRPLMSPSRYLEECLEANIGFEAIGLQIHNPVHDMFEIGLMLDRYARFGKPIHITELGVPSAPIQSDAIGHGTYAIGRHSNVGDYAAAASTGVTIWGHPHYWHEPYNEDVQADWYEQFYTLCYSKPCVTAVTNWLWEDAGTAMGLTSLMARARGERPKGWPPYTGFVKSDLTPKQSYYTLKNLIDRWKAREQEMVCDE